MTDAHPAPNADDSPQANTAALYHALNKEFLRLAFSNADELLKAQATADVAVMADRYILRLEASNAATRARLAECEAALEHELALKKSRADGWRARIAVGDVDVWGNNDDMEKWNAAATSNPHPYTSEYYRAWQSGFLENDTLRRFDRLAEELGECRRAQAEAADTDTGGQP